jgi:hypothetical protein
MRRVWALSIATQTPSLILLVLRALVLQVHMMVSSQGRDIDHSGILMLRCTNDRLKTRGHPIVRLLWALTGTGSEMRMLVADLVFVWQRRDLTH